MMKNTTRCDEGVSEVIGVMLMISVTLIIVALVAVYASNTGVGSDRSIQADLVASGVMEKGGIYQVIYDHRSGDSFSVDGLEVSFSSRERQDLHIILRNDDEKTSINNLVPDTRFIQLGDRFVVSLGEYDPDSNRILLSQSPFVSIPCGEHLTYRFIDRKTGMPISSGEITIKRV
ncbi:type IV pilin N-terminal domain-containing protein [Methanocalculus sp.]|uniref:type IV pilin N-terminal domain-containing protein n=1 Tax=Methanocalculus sp. TaxID=2004547 RepID=UPI00271F132D|nr:type IV pilin N-terminal domain-containing protein [Methanocalculus sp.]MDO8841296.1 type IV pilin N-terminal domain-containing protein [Methanocalculus sp.]